MTTNILEEILKNAQRIKAEPRHSQDAKFALFDNLLNIAMSADYSREDKKAIVQKAENISGKDMVARLIGFAPNAETKELFAEIAVEHASHGNAAGYATTFVKDSGLPVESPSRAAIVQIAIGHLPRLKHDYDWRQKRSEIANRVLAVCETPEEIETAAAQIGKIAVNSAPDDQYTYIYHLSAHDEVIKAVLPALETMPLGKSLVLIAQRVQNATPETRENLLDIAVKRVQAEDTKEIEYLVCNIVNSLPQNDEHRTRLIAGLERNATSHQAAIRTASALENTDDAEKFTAIAEKAIQGIPAFERIEVLKSTYLPEDSWGTGGIKNVAGAEWAGRKIANAIDELEPVEAIKMCLEMNKRTLGKSFEAMETYYQSGQARRPYIVQALRILPSVPKAERLDAARDILFGISDNSRCKELAAQAYLAEVAKLKPAARLKEAQNAVDSYKAVRSYSEKEGFGPGYDVAAALYVAIPDLIKSVKTSSFSDVEKFMYRRLVKNGVDEDFVADLAIEKVKKVKHLDPENRSWELRQLAKDFESSQAKQKILLAAANEIKRVPSKARFETAFRFATDNLRPNSEDGQLNAVAAKGMEVAIAAIGALPKGLQTAAAKAVFDAAATLPTVREALVAAHGDLLPRAGKPMDVASFLKASIG